MRIVTLENSGLMYTSQVYLVLGDRNRLEDVNIRMGDALFEVVHAPGHSSDSICLFNGAEGVLFAGDSPLLLTSAEGNYEAGFQAALDKLCNCNIRRIYFGHGLPLTEHCNQRLRASRRLAGGEHRPCEGSA